MLFHQKTFFVSYKEMKKKMEKGWPNKETVCGGASTLLSTRRVRRDLREFIINNNIKIINDAGCGDMHWIKEILDDEIDYQGYDIIPRCPSVIQIDISSRKMRNCDLIICKDVFMKITQDRIPDTLKMFRKSGKYLFANLSMIDKEPIQKIKGRITIKNVLYYGIWDLQEA